MTRLVVHAGTHATGWTASWRQLVAWRDPLEQRGVRLHPSDSAEAWLTDTRALAAGVTPPEALLSAVESAVRDRADVVLLSSERLEDPLRDPAQLAGLESFATELGLPLTVLMVLRDQLGYLNHVYCERISQLHTARDFPSFAKEPSPHRRFLYDSAFRHLIDSPDVTFVALPYAELRPRVEAKALLAAAGVAASDLAGLPAVGVSESLPGPVLVAGYRLLFKRLWRLGLIKALPRAQLVQTAGGLAVHAAASKWDTHPFWGWDPESRATALNRYGPGNDKLAEEVWQRPWGDEWADGAFEDIDLASQEPQQVADMLDAVDRIVTDLQASRGPASTD